jgi:hypothetical protein
MKCHHCGSLNPDAVRFCNNCGVALNIPASQPELLKISNNAWKWILGVFGGLVLLIIVTATQNHTSTSQNMPSPVTSPENHWESTDGKIEAFVMSQTFMKRRLKAPSTAGFPWYSDSEVSVFHRGGGVFQVKSYVDAQNSFGAKLRTHYLCELKDNGHDSWSLISLTTP